MRPLLAVLLFGPALLACTSETAGIQVAFELAPSTLTAVPSDGRPLALENATLALGSVELIACEGSVETTAPSNGSLGLLHVEGSPTLLGTSGIMNLLGQGAPIALGTLQPPPGRYCSLRQRFFGADSDALGFTDPRDVGATLVVRGTVDGRQFLLRSEALLEVVTPIEPALELSLDDVREASFTLSLGDTSRAFEGVTFDSDNDRDDAQLVLANLRGAVVGKRKQ